MYHFVVLFITLLYCSLLCCAVHYFVVLCRREADDAVLCCDVLEVMRCSKKLFDVFCWVYCLLLCLRCNAILRCFVLCCFVLCCPVLIGLCCVVVGRVVSYWFVQCYVVSCNTTRVVLDCAVLCSLRAGARHALEWPRAMGCPGVAKTAMLCGCVYAARPCAVVKTSILCCFDEPILLPCCVASKSQNIQHK